MHEPQPGGTSSSAGSSSASVTIAPRATNEPCPGHDRHRVARREREPGAHGGVAIDVVVGVDEDRAARTARTEALGQSREALAQRAVGVAPGVARHAADRPVGRRRGGPPERQRRRDHAAGPAHEPLGVARARRVGEREAQVAEEPARAPLGDQALGLGIRLGARDPEQQAVRAELVLHREQPNTICPVRAVRIHEEGGPEVVLVDRDSGARARARRGARPHARQRAQPHRHLDPPGQALASQAAHARRRRRRASSRRSDPSTEGPEPGTDVVINPGLFCGRCEACLRGQQSLCERFAVLGEHVAGTHADYVVVPVAQPAPQARAAELRRGRRLPARLRHRVAHADDPRAPAARRVGARVGRRLGRRQRGGHARLGARRARHRDGLARRRARRGARARRARDDQPPQRRRPGARARAHGRPRRRGRLRARRRGRPGRPRSRRSAAAGAWC